MCWPRPELGNLPEYYNSSDLSDGIVECGGQTFKIHKIILSAQSKFFSTAFNGKWKESIDSVIKLEDDDVSAVESMLRFMYTSNYDDGSRPWGPLPSAMAFNLKVYIVADKYNVPVLKDLAVERFETAVKSFCTKDEFPHIIAEVYDSTLPSNQDLRQVVARAACNNVDRLLRKKAFCDVLEDTVGFATDLAKLQAKSCCRHYSRRPPSPGSFPIINTCTSFEHMFGLENASNDGPGDDLSGESWDNTPNDGPKDDVPVWDRE